MGHTDFTTGKVTITDNIYNQILMKISDGTYAEGSKLPSESELCDMYKASRTSIRNALQRLEGIGLIDTFKGKGSFVKGGQSRRETAINDHPVELTISADGEISMEDYAEFWQFRQALGDKAIEQFVLYAKDEDLDTLEHLIDDMIDAADAEALALKCVDFHMYIYQHCGNRFIANAFENTREFLTAAFRTIQKKRQSKSAIVKWHVKIVDYLRKKDAEAIMVTISEENVLFLHGVEKAVI